MKIVAKVNENEVLVQATKNELANIIGHGSTYDLKDRGGEFIPGACINVSPLWEALSISRARKDDIAKLAKDLRTVAGKVDTINQALASPIIEVKA